MLPAGTHLDLTGWTVVYEDTDGAILVRGPVEVDRPITGHERTQLVAGVEPLAGGQAVERIARDDAAISSVLR